MSRYIIDRDGLYKSLSLSPDRAFTLWKNVHEEVLTMIETFWNTVQHILCADAPEGLVPEDMDEDTNMDTKEILSYSWRGLKEARCASLPPFGSRLIRTASYYASSSRKLQLATMSGVLSLLRYLRS
jgi:hypothetical protein